MPCIESVNNDLKRMSKKDELVIKRKGGGSVIDQKPLFSADGCSIYVIWRHVIRAYSVQTGELIRDYEGLKSPAVGVQVHPYNNKFLLACSEKGELITWKSMSAGPISKIKLRINEPGFKIKSFNLVMHSHNVLDALIAWVVQDKTEIQIGTFGITAGEQKSILPISLKNTSFFISVGGAPGNQFMSVVQHERLFNLSLTKQDVKSKHKSGTNLTCVLCHPEEHFVLTGDVIGRIILWRGIMRKSPPVKTVFHWHTLPVVCMSFTQCGQYFYSGGNECVLVKWRVDNSEQRSYLPRLPAPICHVTVGPGNHRVAISTRDNGIQLADAHNRIVSIIQHFTWGITTSSDPKLSPITTNEPPFSAGLTYDPITQAVILNGRTGHMQFYSTLSRSLLYNVDITNENRLTAERELEIINTSVILVAIGSIKGHSSWMVTIEHRDDKVSHFESRLKFWEYDTSKQTFSLNTSVELPHEGKVLAVEVQPAIPYSSSQSLLCATCGADDRIKIWSLENTNNTYKKGKYWQCIGAAQYKNLPVRTLAFSTDGSLLGCGFGPCVTVWTPDNFGLKCSLMQCGSQSDVKKVLFGKGDDGHLILSCNETDLTVWNLLTLCAIWTVRLSINILTSDPLSTYVAAFTTENQLIIFTANDPEPVYMKHLSNIGQTKGAVWVPNKIKRNLVAGEWQYYSHLYFLDDNQELLCLEIDNEDELITSAVVSSEIGAPLTPFGALIASHKTSDVKQSGGAIHSFVGIPGSSVIKELLLPAPHTMPPVHLLCGNLIRSLLGELQTTDADEMEELGLEDKTFSDSDSDDHVKTSKNRRKNEISDGQAKSKPKTQTSDTESKLKPILNEDNTWAKSLA